MNRRLFLFTLATAVVGASTLGSGEAQEFGRPVTIVVPFSPGGHADALARIIAPALQQNIKQPVIVDNKAGGGGNMGARLVAQSSKDGYTLLLTDITTLASAPSLFANLGFSPDKDLAPVGMVAFSPYLLAVNENLGVKTVAEMVAKAKADPGKLRFATGSVNAHMRALQLAKEWGVQFNIVPYPDSNQANLGVLSGDTDIVLNPAEASAGFVLSGKLRALGISGDRNQTKMEVPSWKELGLKPPLDMGSWYGVLTTAGTPPETLKRLNTELNRVLEMPEVKEKIASLGGEPQGGSAIALGQWMEMTGKGLGGVIKESGFKLQ